MREATLCTPSLASGCLAGITRKVILDFAKKKKLRICEGKFTLQDLGAAQEAFLTNSLMGVMPIRAVEARCISAKAGPMTGSFQKYYTQLLSHGSKKN